MKPADFDVELHDGQLWIYGNKKEEKEEKGVAFHRIERRHGEFRRVIPLPGTLDAEKVEAHYKDDLLKVIIAKTEEAKPKHVKVEI